MEVNNRLFGGESLLEIMDYHVEGVFEEFLIEFLQRVRHRVGCILLFIVKIYLYVDI